MSDTIGLSTTLATNAIVEGARRRVLGFLIGYGPDDFPYALREDAVLIRGGHDVRGEEREPLDTETLREIVERKKDGIEASAGDVEVTLEEKEHWATSRVENRFSWRNG
jgi:N-methylhydantoinase A/oxoprolinase/acetone carboxylase beta subunit